MFSYPNFVLCIRELCNKHIWEGIPFTPQSIPLSCRSKHGTSNMCYAPIIMVKFVMCVVVVHSSVYCFHSKIIVSSATNLDTYTNNL